MRYFTSDTHYFHEKLLGSNDFAPRPFASVSEMHEVMVANWNQVVQAQDTVYHLGDIALHPEHEAGFAELLALLVRLQGKIAFIKGNHDTRALFRVGLLLKFDHHQYYLSHYPMLLGMTKNSRNLHGHIHHHSLPIAENINVGVDAPELAFLPQPWPFGRPISENQLERIFQAKQAEIHQTFH